MVKRNDRYTFEGKGFAARIGDGRVGAHILVPGGEYVEKLPNVALHVFKQIERSMRTFQHRIVVVLKAEGVDRIERVLTKNGIIYTW